MRSHSTKPIVWRAAFVQDQLVHRWSDTVYGEDRAIVEEMVETAQLDQVAQLAGQRVAVLQCPEMTRSRSRYRPGHIARSYFSIDVAHERFQAWGVHTGDTLWVDPDIHRRERSTDLQLLQAFSVNSGAQIGLHLA